MESLYCTEVNVDLTHSHIRNPAGTIFPTSVFLIPVLYASTYGVFVSSLFSFIVHSVHAAMQ